MRAVFENITPFLLLALMVLLSFSIVFYSLFHNEQLDALPDKAERLFSSMLGMFDVRVSCFNRELIFLCVAEAKSNPDPALRGKFV